VWQLDLATSGKGGIGPFIGLCAVFACFGITHAIVQGGVCGELSFMCPKFIQVGLPNKLYIFLVSVLKIIV
jgi:equilibrative nucleoside transporter 1/2/3